MELVGFEDTWEHIRLLADRRRTTTMIELLRRRAPGARVLEVGTGTGLLACAAARLGATRVWAVEPTERWGDARALVHDNGLGDIVRVLPGRIEEVDPRPVDFAFSELLNADPLIEGVLSAMDAAARWIDVGGRLAPAHLRLGVALVEEAEPADEATRARELLAALGAELDLDLRRLDQEIAGADTYRFLAPSVREMSDGVVAWQAELGRGHEPPEEIEVVLKAARDGFVAGATVWFEADYDHDLILHNRPGRATHWGHLVCGWPSPVGLCAGDEVRLRVRFDDEGTEITPA